MQEFVSEAPSLPLRVLVVDDDELDRFVIRRSFNALGMPVELIEIADSRQAVDAIDRHEPDVTLLDIQMPNMNGFDVLTALRKKHRKDPAEPCPVMMLSSSSQQDDREKAFALGATEYRTKPSTLNDYIRLAEDIREAYLPN
ncbi:MAG: response regulator [Rhizobiales bacterium]|nr:response regulator [Hyphomicrobiales bacterium]MBO6699848.1 response regulator [Hyphomicrobiales bacterium]MBO6737386.1 response regulator [Hyphomicrobiales bacterium]MBO6911540.1 response regulator [Hyphomicrobiales bacterium]MBO6955160.1 response regulator [Hyphomicrobiales bacterium]